MKYIVTKNEEGEEEIFLFPRSINHDCMAEVLGRIKDQTTGNWTRIFRNPVSAGFVENGRCHGRSETLKLEARPEDSDILNAYFQNPHQRPLKRNL